MRFIVLSSSRGTTFAAVLDRIADGSLKAECLGLVTDREDRGCTDKARAAGIPVAIVPKRRGEEREAYDRRLHEALTSLGEADVLGTLGWMWILSPWFIEKWRGKIINVHPSLLPAYPGAHAIEDALKDGATETGMTIHIVDEGVDTGPVLLQKSCMIDENETPASLKEKIQALEREWYPKVLAEVAEGKKG